MLRNIKRFSSKATASNLSEIGSRENPIVVYDYKNKDQKYSFFKQTLYLGLGLFVNLYFYQRSF